jgi:hypothetical protein
MQIRIGIPYVFTLVMEQEEFVARCKQGWERTKDITNKTVGCVQPTTTQVLLYATYGSCVVAQVVADASGKVHRKLQNHVVDLACKRVSHVVARPDVEEGTVMQRIMRGQSIN